MIFCLIEHITTPGRVLLSRADLPAAAAVSAAAAATAAAASSSGLGAAVGAAGSAADASGAVALACGAAPAAKLALCGVLHQATFTRHRQGLPEATTRHTVENCNLDADQNAACIAAAVLAVITGTSPQWKQPLKHSRLVPASHAAPAAVVVLTVVPAPALPLVAGPAPAATAAGLPAGPAPFKPAPAGAAGPEEGPAAAAAACRAAAAHAVVPGALEARPCSE